MDKYCVYYEIKWYDDAIIEEGGFFYASSCQNAAETLEKIYDNIESMTIELYDNLSFVFPIEKARELKKHLDLIS